jgi:hypothetical protein
MVTPLLEIFGVSGSAEDLFQLQCPSLKFCMWSRHPATVPSSDEMPDIVNFFVFVAF